jgi:ubiquitin-conjugating enzyme E2 Q
MSQATGGGKGEEEDEIEEILDRADDDEIIIGEYYDRLPIVRTEREEEQEAMQALLDRFNPATAAARRLLHDLRRISQSDPQKLGFRSEPDGKDIFNWTVKLFGFPKGSEIYNDLRQYESQTRRNYVELRLAFPPDYPNVPPFVRVVRPRFVSHTGHVTFGGSICTTMLTMEAWNPSFDVQSVIGNVFAEMCQAGARIDFSSRSPYSLEDARSAFEIAADNHNWSLSGWMPSG